MFSTTPLLYVNFDLCVAFFNFKNVAIYDKIKDFVFFHSIIVETKN